MNTSSSIKWKITSKDKAKSPLTLFLNSSSPDQTKFLLCRFWIFPYCCSLYIETEVFLVFSQRKLVPISWAPFNHEIYRVFTHKFIYYFCLEFGQIRVWSSPWIPSCFVAVFPVIFGVEFIFFLVFYLFSGNGINFFCLWLNYEE